MQVIFHFVAKRLDEEKTLLDDSRKWSKPMEIILGKKFKLESWETSLATMRIGEVASFTTKRMYTRVVRGDINFKIQRDPLDFLVPIDQ